MISVFERCSFGIKKIDRKKRGFEYVPFMTITSTNLELLRKMKQTIGFGYICLDTRIKNIRDTFIFAITGKKNLKIFIDRYGDQITTKQEHIKLLREYVNEPRIDDIEYKEQIREQLQELNK